MKADAGVSRTIKKPVWKDGYTMFKNFLKAVLLTVFALSAAAAFAADPGDVSSERDPERVLAIVEDHEIKERDVDRLLADAGPQAVMMLDNEEGRRLILDELIAIRLFALYGQKQGLDEDPDFMRSLDSFITQSLALAAIESIMKDISVSDDESRMFYDENPDEFTTPEQINVRHILLADDETSDDMIAFIQQELENGVPFDVLAAEHSIDPSAPMSGGDLGFFGRGRMVPEFEEAAFALSEPGDISEPVKSNFGWHIIKLEEVRPLSVLPFDEVKPQIEQNLTNEKMAEKYLEELEALKDEFSIEILTE